MVSLELDNFNEVKIKIFHKVCEFERDYVDIISLNKDDYPTHTKYMSEKNRHDLMKTKINNAKKKLLNPKDSGGYGRGFEIIIRRDLSNKTTVSLQDKEDLFLPIVCRDGKSRRKGVEAKTGGGNIENVKSEYMIYGYIYGQPHECKMTGEKWKTYLLHSPIIVPTKYFLSFLDSINGLKPVGKNIKIVNSKAALREFVQNGLVYDRTHNYTEDEILSHYGL